MIDATDDPALVDDASDVCAARGQRSRSQQRSRSGQRSRRTSWMPEPGEDGEPAVLTDQQRTKLTERAFSLCLWHLGQSAKTRKELHDVMARKDVPSDIIDATLARLTGLGYLDDAAYAEAFTRSRHEARRQGSRAIRQALRYKGVDEDTVEEALESITTEAETENARALVGRKASSTRGLDRPKRVNRLVSMLIRRGYPSGMAFTVVREVLDADAAADVSGDLDDAHDDVTAAD